MPLYMGRRNLNRGGIRSAHASSVLIVVDDRAVRQTLAEYLDGHGFCVAQATAARFRTAS